ncbi:RNA-guided endonuclease InsQ/TnpB family protein [Lysinibacter cavernae]|uniref:RNA-guided endonuclease InsQ/TnpB family protein n=1 Tax=Lysinibacter cavernae TaxID=1640652 RepID=UPI00360E0744
MHKAHKIELDLTNKQATALARAAGCSRFAYNWALARWNEQYQARLVDPSLPSPSQYALRKELNAIKRAEMPWMLESTKCAPQEAIIDLGTAFNNYFAGRAKRPKFKKRGIHDSFKLSAGEFGVAGKKLRVPKIGWVRMRESFRFEATKLISVTISRTANTWFASITCEMPDQEPQLPSGRTVGVDVGVREYVTSDGARHQVPRALRASQTQLKRAQQSLTRKQKGSANRAKQRKKVALLHQHVANVRGDWMHKLTTELANTYDTIVIEDLNVKGMTKNHRLALSIADAGFGEFRRQLEYKTRERGTTLVLADRWYPSSKTCSTCGTKIKSLPLNIREWTCSNCETVHDRDLNAAYNLAAYKHEAASPAVSVCGAFSATDKPGASLARQAPATKQKLDNDQHHSAFV